MNEEKEIFRAAIALICADMVKKKRRYLQNDGNFNALLAAEDAEAVLASVRTGYEDDAEEETDEETDEPDDSLDRDNVEDDETEDAGDHD